MEDTDTVGEIHEPDLINISTFLLFKERQGGLEHCLLLTTNQELAFS